MKPYEEGDYFGSHVCLDFETTNNQYGNACYPNEIVCAVWYFSDTDKYYYADSDYSLLIEHLFSAKVLIAQNAKMELKWLQKLGAFLVGLQVFDPMLSQYSLDGVQRHPVNLDALCTRYGLENKDPIIDQLMKSGVCPSEMPVSMLKDRCLLDVQTTLQLYHILSNKLLDAGLFPLYHTKAELCKVLADMELNGMYLDSDRVRDVYVERGRQYEIVTDELDQFTGGINHNSPKQKQEYLYDVLKFKELKGYDGKPKRTPAGGRLTDSATINSLSPSNDSQRTYLELLKKHSKLFAELSKALDKFQECVEEGGMMYADFNQHITVSHRLSSSGTKHKVQFQNLQREFKKLFKAREEDWLIMEADGAQIEFRVAGYLGHDEQIKYDIDHGEDVHRFTAHKMFGVPEEEVTGDQRTASKADTFAPLYGREFGTEAQVEYFKAFREKYPDITETQEGWVTQVTNFGKFTLPTGLTLEFPNRKLSRSGRLDVRNKILNYPVQYLATGEIIPIAVCYAHLRMRTAGLKSFLINTVHDSVIAEVHPDEVDIMSDIMKSAFTDDVYDYLYDNYGMKFNLPLGIGIKVGPHWGEGEEVKQESAPKWAWS